MVLALTASLRLRKVVDVDGLGADAGENLVPVQRPNVTEVVVVEETDVARQNI